MIVDPIPHWQQSVIEESNDLVDKICRLTRFLTSSKYQELSESDRRDLQLQRYCMEAYARVLNRRIKRFFDEPENYKS